MIYNEFRPMNFSKVRGQQVNKTILLNQLKENKISHSYIFHGLHGSGKTTCARIFAHSLNCQNPIDGEPCNKCDSCMGINTDIYEIDAASNNKVEDVAKIKENIIYPPKNKYKVFILDEAHMLSKSAWNALLTTIENPPENVVFIFCSTEINKFPDTISSRCMKLTFSNISTKEIIDNLEFICKEKNFEYTQKGLMLLANISNGSMRDALSSLEKCIHYGSLSEKNIADTLGLVDQGNVFSIIKSMIEKDTESMLKKVEDLFNLGKNMGELTMEILYSLKDISIYSITKNPNIVSKDIKYLSAFHVDNNELYKAITRFYSLIDTIKYSDCKRTLLEINLLETSTYFSKAKVDDFNCSIDFKENVTTNTPKEEKVQLNNTEEKKEIFIPSLLNKKVDLLKSYDLSDPELLILLKSKFYSKKNSFVIKSPDVDKLNKNFIIEKMSEICGINNINVIFQN